MVSSNGKYRFGVFELSTRARELYKRGRKLKLRPQPFQVLLLLVENAGEVVTREQLRERVWTSDTFVDFEHGLNTAIKELRAVLSDSAKEPKYIETLPKLGYRLIVPVERGTEAPAAEPEAGDSAGGDAGLTAETSGAELAQPEARWSPAARKAWIVAAAALVLAGVGLVAMEWARAHPPVTEKAAGDSNAGGRVMLAVLPFENLTGDSGEDYFSDGMTEEMIAQLGRLNPVRMGVIGRASVMRYKRSADALEQVKRQLGVQYVLEGSVRRENDRVRVTARLIKTQDETRVWGKQYDRELNNLLALQAEIAGEIAREVDLQLAAPGGSSAGAGSTLPAERLAAYDLYLRGRYFWNKRTGADLERAAEEFEQSVAKDPGYARGYAGLAETYALLSTYNVLRPGEAMPKARSAAQRALQLDESLAEAHNALALIDEYDDWDWATAEKEYRRAIELDPNYATAHQWYAEELAIVGRSGEAIAEIERARTLDPLSMIIDADYGAILYYARRYDAAIERLQEVTTLEPFLLRATMVVLPYVQERRYAEALALIGRWDVKGSRPPTWTMAYRVYIYASEGEMDKARHEVARLRETTKPNQPTANELALAWTSVGDKQKALDALEQAYRERTIFPTLMVDSSFDPLRGEPRFQKILQGMHLTPPSGAGK